MGASQWVTACQSAAVPTTVARKVSVRKLLTSKALDGLEHSEILDGVSFCRLVRRRQPVRRTCHGIRGPMA